MKSGLFLNGLGKPALGKSFTANELTVTPRSLYKVVAAVGTGAHHFIGGFLTLFTALRIQAGPLSGFAKGYQR